MKKNILGILALFGTILLLFCLSPLDRIGFERSQHLYGFSASLSL